MSEIEASLFESDNSYSVLNYIPEEHEPLLIQATDAKRPLAGRYQDLKTPSGEEVFGVVYCRAISKFGEQKKPCTFVVKPAGKYFLDFG